MVIRRLFSREQRQARGELPDVYQYKDFPEKLRVQVMHALREMFGANDITAKAYAVVYDRVCKEEGLLTLHPGGLAVSHDQKAIWLFDYFGRAPVEHALDVIMLSLELRYEYDTSSSGFGYYNAAPLLSKVIEEINQRFAEAGFGYFYEGGTFLRRDSELLHQTAVRPALEVLRDADFAGANEEFLRAHDHFRHGRTQECNTDCLRAFESTLKTICRRLGWSYSERDTAKQLLDIVFTNRLLPDYLQSEFAAVRSTLESGVPTVRNRDGGHGQGPERKKVPLYLSKYALNMTAASIVLLAEAAAEHKPAGGGAKWIPFL